MQLDAPIGVFDSGLGGLTVVQALRSQLPEEDLVYLGDTARVPYGTRSASTVIRYARSCAARLRDFDIKLLVVACNTVSAVAIDVLRAELDIPVLGVIVPGAAAAVKASKTGRIAVIATTGTVKSGAYTRAVAGVSCRVEVFAKAAPLLVPLVEEGWLSGPIVDEVVLQYLKRFLPQSPDVVVLGCTHYPLLRTAISNCACTLFGADAKVVDGSAATAAAVAECLDARSLRRTRKKSGSESPVLRLLVTDLPGEFQEQAGRFLGKEGTAASVSCIDL
ncbi:MAG: glutamate racemase [Myxococcota bacterium]